MERVTIDPEGRVALGAVDHELAVTDASGKTLAYVLPPAVYTRFMEAWLASEPSQEELNAARQETGGMNISEVLTHLADVERQWKERR
jgi:hypothetical protein